ncbi:MAG: RecQ family ATP-dependent DNA helicase [Patescibacteria group bacterium]|jgi:ATP-dependent DNA helicase RecQ
MNAKKQQLKDLLKIHFGYESFRPGQEEALDAILNNQDTVVILPTGGGKSLIYQLPALVLDGVTVVVSPLIALMKDQVDSLEKVGIPATFINSSISPVEMSARWERVVSGYYKIVYLAPERFYNQNFLVDLKKIKVSLLAIDEAHCISQWGHDFRPSYLRLKEAAKLMGRPPIVALTATATPEVREDIVAQLQLKNPAQIVTGFSRPNLQFAVVQANNNQKIQYIVDTVSDEKLGCGIIYTGTRAKADELANLLVARGVEAVVYHAGLDASSRAWVQDSFISGQARVVIATNAFGLGVNKKNVRFVIHHDLPGTIEAYYQEAGRAGRDGLPSFCLLFYTPQDRYLREFFIKGDNPEPHIIREVYDLLRLWSDSNEKIGQDTVLFTYSEIIQNLSESVPEMTVGSVLKILEKEGYLSRPNEKTSNGFLKAKVDYDTLLNFISRRAKTQLEVVNALFEKFAAELKSGWDFNLEEAATIIGVKKESLNRTIKKLAEQDLLEYRPPFRGTEVRILKKTRGEDLNLNFKVLKEKAARAYEKLDEMEQYVYQVGCREQYILKYFGVLDAKECGHCDRCLKAARHLSKGGEDYRQREYLK